MKSLFAALLFLLPGLLHAQKVDVDRQSGLVTVNGLGLCYIVPSSTGAVKQFLVKNLQQKELMMVSENEGKRWDRELQTFVGDDFRVVFLETHNWCTANGTGVGFNNFQKIAKMLVSERLIANDDIFPEAERNFIRNHNGIFVTKIPPGSASASTKPVAVPQQQPAAKSDSAFIRVEYLDGDKYFVNGKVAGTFVRKSGTPETIQFYAADDVKTATAVRTDDEWEITTKDGKKATLRYYATGTVERLFAYLVSKGYLGVK